MDTTNEMNARKEKAFVKRTLDALKAKGFTVKPTKNLLAYENMDDCVMGNDAYELLSDLLDRKGTFYTLKILSAFDAMKVSGAFTKAEVEEWECYIGDTIDDKDVLLVAPAKFKGDTNRYLVFELAKKGSRNHTPWRRGT
jgi:hypothetical protein